MKCRKYLLFFAACSLVTTVGCSEYNSSPPGMNSSATPSAHKKLQSPVYTFGIIYPMAHPFYEVITDNAEKAAASNSAQLLVKAPEKISVEQQILMMENMIKKKVNGIAIDPIDPDALAPTINKAVESGIPVICFEADSPQSQRLTYIGPDHYKAGNLMGQIVSRQMKGNGMVLVETSMANSFIQKERLTGMLDYFSENTNIQVLDVEHNEGSSDKALTDMEQMIDNHPHFDALLTLDVLSSSASILLWKAKGLNRKSLTLGMMPVVKEAIVNGQITSVISQNEYTWGELIIEQLLKANHGEKVPTSIDTGIIEINKDVLGL